MKKLVLFIVITILSVQVTLSQQDLVFDNIYNNGSSYYDNYSSNYPDYQITTYGRMKKLNDSVFVYFINAANYTSNIIHTEVRAVINHSNGTTNHLTVYSEDVSVSPGSENDYFFTDVITNGSNGQLFLVRNGLWDDNGSTRQCIRVYGFVYTAAGTITTINNWGDNGSGVTQILGLGLSFSNAKGSLIGNNPCIAFSENSFNSNQISFTALGNNGVYGTFVTITANQTNTFSSVADITAVSASEVYIADNSFTYLPTTQNYSDNARILKWNPTGFALDNTYGGGDGIVTLPWSSWTGNSSNVQDNISRILYDGGKLLVAGSTDTDYLWGCLSRFNSDGSLDNTFGTNGSSNPNLSPNFERWPFYDIDIASDGSYYISGSRSVTSSSTLTGFIIKMNNTGVLQTNIGDNGFLALDLDYRRIAETIIIPGNSTLEDKFVLNALTEINPSEEETAIGRLVWSNSGSSNNCAITDITINDVSPCYPATNSYSITITTTYENSGSADSLHIGGFGMPTKVFQLTQSPQTVIVFRDFDVNPSAATNLSVWLTSSSDVEFSCIHPAISGAWVAPEPCGITGINEVSPNSLLNIYPNPIMSILNIEAKENTNVRIVNTLGQIVMALQLNTGENSISVSNFHSGVYFIHTENGSITKFIKK